jgi:aromatic-L-amino-acid/L-tryptophan decarboxylase
MVSFSTMDEPIPSRCELTGRSDLSPESLRAFAHEAVDWMVDYLTGFANESFGPIQPEGPARLVFDRFRDDLPEEGMPPARVLKEFQERVVPFATHLQHPGNLGYIPNSSGIVGIVADLLASTLNQNVSLVRGGASAAAIEAEVVRWLQTLLDFPADGGGVLTSGGSLANLMAISLARARSGGERGFDSIPPRRLTARSSAHCAFSVCLQRPCEPSTSTTASACVPIA